MGAVGQQEAGDAPLVVAARRRGRQDSGSVCVVEGDGIVCRGGPGEGRGCYVGDIVEVRRAAVADGPQVRAGRVGRSWMEDRIDLTAGKAAADRVACGVLDAGD